AVIIFFALALPVENSNAYISTSSVGGFTEMMTSANHPSSRQPQAQLEHALPVHDNIESSAACATGACLAGS
ncbi:MAG: hypothetical protein MRZ57_09055, partial [Bacteroidales bacterium]|nr:hypothetical protein [Bacteroidales bacterium]